MTKEKPNICVARHPSKFHVLSVRCISRDLRALILNFSFAIKINFDLN